MTMTVLVYTHIYRSCAMLGQATRPITSLGGGAFRLNTWWGHLGGWITADLFAGYKRRDELIGDEKLTEEEMIIVDVISIGGRRGEGQQLEAFSMYEECIDVAREDDMADDDTDTMPIHRDHASDRHLHSLFMSQNLSQCVMIMDVACHRYEVHR